MQSSRKTLIFLLIGSGIIVLLKLLSILVISFLALGLRRSEASSIGVIGGADGPTAIFLSGKFSFGSVGALLPAVIEIAFLVFIFVFAARSLKNKR